MSKCPYCEEYGDRLCDHHRNEIIREFLNEKIDTLSRAISNNPRAVNYDIVAHRDILVSYRKQLGGEE